jgi:hypothetical protein
LQETLNKQHKKLVEQKQKKQMVSKQEGSAEGSEDITPFDPEYPYHPKRKQPMQPSPHQEEEEATKLRPDLPIQPPNEEQNPIEVKPKLLEPKDVSNVKELLQEYDLSGSIDAPRNQQPSPDDPHRLLETPKRSSPDYDMLQAPGEEQAELRSHPQSPSVSSSQQQRLAPEQTGEEHPASTQPPADLLEGRS